MLMTIVMTDVMVLRVAERRKKKEQVKCLTALLSSTRSQGCRDYVQQLNRMRGAECAL
jgi:hypothetical protein